MLQHNAGSFLTDARERVYSLHVPSWSPDLRPINPYGMTKKLAEMAALRYMRAGVDIVGLRYFNVVGVGRRPEYAAAVPRFAERLAGGLPPVVHGDGSQIKDFVAVDDVVDATVLAMLKDDIPGGFYNVGSGRPTSVIDLARRMARISGRELRPEHTGARPGDAACVVADTSKTSRTLGWRPQASLDEMLQGIIEHCRVKSRG